VNSNTGVTKEKHEIFTKDKHGILIKKEHFPIFTDTPIKQNTFPHTKSTTKKKEKKGKKRGGWRA